MLRFSSVHFVEFLIIQSVFPLADVDVRYLLKVFDGGQVVLQVNGLVLMQIIRSAFQMVYIQ